MQTPYWQGISWYELNLRISHFQTMLNMPYLYLYLYLQIQIRIWPQPCSNHGLGHIEQISVNYFLDSHIFIEKTQLKQMSILCCQNYADVYITVTHSPRMPHPCSIGFCQHCFEKCLGARSAQRHFSNECWFLWYQGILLIKPCY